MENDKLNPSSDDIKNAPIGAMIFTEKSIYIKESETKWSKLNLG